GRRDSANELLAKDPALLGPDARRYTHLPGGHQEGWADAFANIIRDIYACIANGGVHDAGRAPAFATFEDGYRVALLVDAVLERHRNGGAWTKVAAMELAGGVRLSLVCSPRCSAAWTSSRCWRR